MNHELHLPATLASLPQATVARVSLVLEHDSDARLKAMGICPGRSVQVVQSGDPLIVRVIGTRVGVSARLASQVLVEPAGGEGDSLASASQVSGPSQVLAPDAA